MFALFAALPWRPAEAAGVLAAFALAITAAGVWTLSAALGGSDATAFTDGRLVGPVGYENASAALLLVAFWPALMLAAERSAPRVARGVLLAAAGVLIQLVVLAQSRGSLGAVAVSLALAVLLHRERRRLLAFLAAVAITTVAALPALLRPYATAGTAGEAHGALVAAAVAMAISAAVLLAAGLASARLDGRRRSAASRAPRRRWLAAGRGSRAGRCVARVGAGHATHRGRRLRPLRLLARRCAGSSRDHPLQGAGADNFAHDYARERRRREEPLYPHSIILGSLGHTGLVGASLLAGFLAAAFAGLRRLGAADDPRRTVGLVAVVSVAAWLTQASIDWLWELPAVTAPGDRVPRAGRRGCGRAAGRRGPGGRGRRFVVGGAALACAAAASYALPALAAREIERAVRVWDADPRAALAGLDRARDLNLLTDRPDVIAGALALRDGDRATARRAFGRAVRRDGQNWYAQVELALIETSAGAARAGAAAQPARAGDRRRAGRRPRRPPGSGLGARAALRAHRSRPGRTPLRRLPAGARPGHELRPGGRAVSVGATALTSRAPARFGDRALGALAVLAAVPAGCALALALYRFPPPLALAVAGGAGLVAVLALALARFHAAVALGFVLLGVVVVDPAPVRRRLLRRDGGRRHHRRLPDGARSRGRSWGSSPCSPR